MLSKNIHKVTKTALADLPIHISRICSWTFRLSGGICNSISNTKPGNPATLLNSNVRSSRQCGIHCPIHCNLDRRRSKHPRQRGASPRKTLKISSTSWPGLTQLRFCQTTRRRKIGLENTLILICNSIKFSKNLAQPKSKTTHRLITRI